MAFANDVVGGITLVRPAIQSANYVPNVSGWTINRDGSAEFASGTFRGPVIIEDGNGNVIASIGATGNGSFQNVTVTGDIILGTQSVRTLLTEAARGLVAEANLYGTNVLPNVPAANVFVDLLWAQFFYDSSRQYRIVSSPITYNNTTSATPEDFFVRVLLNGAQLLNAKYTTLGGTTSSVTFNIECSYGPATHNPTSGPVTLIVQAACDESSGSGFVHSQANSEVWFYVMDIGSGVPPIAPQLINYQFFANVTPTGGTVYTPGAGVEWWNRGLEFYVTSAATIVGLWNYNPDGTGTTRPAQLYTVDGINADGTTHGTAVTGTSVTIPSASGWQFAAFTTPITATINQRYRAVVYQGNNKMYHTVQFVSDVVKNGNIVWPSEVNAIARGQSSWHFSATNTGIQYTDLAQQMLFNQQVLTFVGTNAPRTDGPYTLAYEWYATDTIEVTQIEFFSVRTNIIVNQACIFIMTSGTTGSIVSGTLTNINNSSSVANGWNTFNIPTPFTPVINQHYAVAVCYSTANFDSFSSTFVPGPGNDVHGPVTIPAPANSISGGAGHFAVGSTIQFPSITDTASHWWYMNFRYNYVPTGSGAEYEYIDVSVNQLTQFSSTTGGTGAPPGTQTFLKNYVCTNSRSYDSSGNYIGAPDGDTNVYQGTISGRSHGNEQAIVLFDSATIRSDLSGSALVSAYAWFYCTTVDSSYSSGSLEFGTSSDTSIPNPLVDNGTGDYFQNQSWPVPGWQAMDILANGALNDIIAGKNSLILEQRNFGLFGTGFYGFGGPTSLRPFLQITYNK